MKYVYKMQQECSAIYGNYTRPLPYLWALKLFGVEDVLLLCIKHIFQSTSKLGTSCLLHILGDNNGDTWSE